MITLEFTEEQMKTLSQLAEYVPLLKNLMDVARKSDKKAPVTERIKTYEDACRELGREPYDESQLAGLGLTRNDIAYLKMAVIVEVLNEGWTPDVCDDGIQRWYPYFRPKGSSSSFAFIVSVCDGEGAYAGSGSRLALKSEALSNYCGAQFIELWKELIL